MTQNILFPNASLLLLHKGWKVQGQVNAEKPTASYAKNRGLAPVFAEARNDDTPSRTSRPASQSVSTFRFVNEAGNPSKKRDLQSRVKNHAARKVTHRTSARGKQPKPDSNLNQESKWPPGLMITSKDDSRADAGTNRGQLSNLVCSGSASALYASPFSSGMTLETGSLINICRSM
jgi:hypothetical protein